MATSQMIRAEEKIGTVSAFIVYYLILLIFCLFGLTVVLSQLHSQLKHSLHTSILFAVAVTCLETVSFNYK